MQLLYVIFIWLFVYFCMTVFLEASKLIGADNENEDSDAQLIRDQLGNAKVRYKSSNEPKAKQDVPHLDLKSRYNEENDKQTNMLTDEELMAPLNSEFADEGTPGRGITDMDQVVADKQNLEYGNTFEVPKNAGFDVNTTVISDFIDSPESLDEEFGDDTINSTYPNLGMSIPLTDNNLTVLEKHNENSVPIHNTRVKPLVRQFTSPVWATRSHTCRSDLINTITKLESKITERRNTTNLKLIVPITISVQYSPALPYITMNDFKGYSNKAKMTKLYENQSHSIKNDPQLPTVMDVSWMQPNGKVMKSNVTNQLPYKVYKTRHVNHELTHNDFMSQNDAHDLVTKPYDLLRDQHNTALLTNKLHPKKGTASIEMPDYILRLNSLDPIKQETAMVCTLPRDADGWESDDLLSNASLIKNGNVLSNTVKKVNTDDKYKVGLQSNVKVLDILTNNGMITTGFDVTTPSNNEGYKSLKKKEDINLHNMSKYNTSVKRINDMRYSKQKAIMGVPNMVAHRDTEPTSFTKMYHPRSSSLHTQQEGMPANVLSKLNELSRQTLITSNKVLNGTFQRLLKEPFMPGGLFNYTIPVLFRMKNVSHSTADHQVAHTVDKNSSDINTEETQTSIGKLGKTTTRDNSGKNEPTPQKLNQNSDDLDSAATDKTRSYDMSTSVNSKGSTRSLNEESTPANSVRKEYPVDKTQLSEAQTEVAAQILNDGKTNQKITNYALGVTQNCGESCATEAKCVGYTRCIDEGETDIQTPYTSSYISIRTIKITLSEDATECTTKCIEKSPCCLERQLRSTYADSKDEDHMRRIKHKKSERSRVYDPSHRKIVKVIGNERYMSKIINALKAGPISELMLNLNLDDSVNVTGTIKCKYLNKEEQ